MKDTRLICCDWGTSAFRLYLIDAEHLKVICKAKSPIGVANMNDVFESQTSATRVDIFVQFINEQLGLLSKETSEDITGLPVILSGMASSTIGITEVAYTPLPFNLFNPKLNFVKIAISPISEHDLYIYGGLRGNDDVMRGEEVQLLGLRNILGDKNCICLLPGSHSKHVTVEKGVVTHFDTFITGEMFDILINHSILKNSIDVAFSMEEKDEKIFVEGVLHGATFNLLNGLFKVRTKDIIGNVPPKQNYFYLSGMLIGFELKGLKNVDHEIFLCSSENLANYYRIALNAILGEKSYSIISAEKMKKVIPRAHNYLFKNLDYSNK